jgi:phosphatidylserine/phosphatidylglycerophosphate/cardiolipin synthase-like enzyme
VTRQILLTATSVRNAAREVLQSLFAAELLAPSRCVWIVSPWLRDVPILDNSTGAFSMLSPDFPLADVRLSLVLRELLSLGSDVVIATRPGDGNRQVIDSIEGCPRFETGFTFVERSTLHLKGIVNDRCALLGSMNLTYSGVERLTEMLILETTAPRVQRLRVEFSTEYGGTL